MGEERRQMNVSVLARRCVVHTGLLFAAMAAPFFMLKIATASLTAVGIGSMYVLWWLVTLYLRDRGKPKQPAKVRLLFILYDISVPIAVQGLLFALIVEWPLWAYRPLTRSSDIWDGGMAALIAIAATMIFPPILFLLFAPLLAREGGGPASRFLKGVRAKGFGWFHDNWLRYVAFNAGLFCLLSIAWVPSDLRELAWWRDGDGIVTIWELIAAYPFLPFSLLAAAAILSLSRILETSREGDDAVVRAYIDGAKDAPLPAATANSVLTAVTAGALVAALFFIIYPFHLSITAKGVADGRKALKGVIEALRILENTHEDDDWTNAETAAALNRFGHWTPDAPGAGLGALVADPGQAFPDSCTVRIAAGVIDPPTQDRDGPSVAGEIEPELRACIAVACAPPFTWSAPPALLLLTNRSSQAEGWGKYWYADVSAEGVAAAPGGYCTRNGELAAEYQG